MGDLLNELIRKVKAERLAARRYVAMLLALAMLTSISVSWRLHQVGMALTTDEEYYCGYEEHIHDDSCYTEELVCGYEEGEIIESDPAFGVDAEEPADEPDAPAESETPAEPEEPKVEVHHHTEACYQEVTELTCDYGEHTHDELCYDTETGDLLCTVEEHTHDESCYTTHEELVCGYEEGEEIPVEEDADAVPDAENSGAESSAEDTVVFDEPESTVAAEPEVHHHTEACYEKVLTCTLPEHTHTLECLANWSADVEGRDDWDKYGEGLSDCWTSDLVQVAVEQLGYTESEKNFTVDEALGEAIDVHHYTRYGQWYGNPYAAWDVMFVSFCQHYAGIPKEIIPQRAGLFALRTDLEAAHPEYLTEGGAKAAEGQIVTYYNSDGEETIGIVEAADEETGELTVISGAVNGKVAEVVIQRADITNTILVTQAWTDYYGYPLDDDEPDTDEEPEQPSDEDADEAEYDEVLSFDADAILEQEGAVAYILKGTNPYAIMLAADEDADDERTAAAPTLSYDSNGNLKLDDLLIGEGISIKQTINGVVTWIPLTDGAIIGNETSVRVEMNYTVPNNAFKNGSNSATYTLPAGVYPKKDIQGNVTNASGEPIGTFELKKGSPEVKFTFFDPSNGFSGTFMFETEVSYEETMGLGTIKLGSHRFEISPEYSLDAEKSGVLSADGQTVSYTVTVKAPYGTNGNPVTITDAFDLDKSTAKGTYQKDTLKINGKPLSEYPGASITYRADGSGFTIKDLPALTYNEPSYTLTYDVKVDDIKGADGSGTLVNQAAADSGKWNDTASKEVTVKESGLEKKGVYDPATNRITWTITVKNPGVDLVGYKVTDTQVTALNILGDVVVKDSAGTQITTISGRDFLNNGYTFPAGSTDASYTFTYMTEAPEPVNGTIHAENRATLENGSFTYTTAGVVSSGVGIWDIRKSFSSIAPMEDGNQKITWNVTGTVPAGVKNFRIVDNIRYRAFNSNYGDLYGKKSELEQAIHENLRLTMEGGTILTWAQAEAAGIQMTLTFYSNGSNDRTDPNDGEANKVTDDRQEVHRFKLDFVRTDGTKLGILGFAISDIPTIAKTADLENNATTTFWNRADLFSDGNWKEGYFANRDYKKTGSIEKVNSVTTDGFQQNSTTDYAKNKVIWYKITLYLDEASYQPQTIVDKIPDGMTLATGAFNDFQISVDIDANAAMKFTGYISSLGRDKVGFAYNGYTYYSIDVSQAGQLTIRVFPNGGTPPVQMFAPNKTQHAITIRYALQIDDAYWNDRTHTEKDYINTAEWNGSSDSSSMKVIRTEKKPVEKSGVYDANTHQANYTIVVNPSAKNLSPVGDTLELTDTMSSTYFGQAGMELMLDSVKVYEYLLQDGEWVIGNEVINGCQVKAGTRTGSEREYTFILPDEKALVLKYSYKMNTDQLAGDLDVSNTVVLEGKTYRSNPVKVVKDAAIATANNAVLTVTKTDAATNLAITTSPATFELYHYNKASDVWDSLGEKTTVNGSFDLTFSNNVSAASGLLEMGDLYKIVETASPTNYKLDDAPHYFIWSSTATDDTAKQVALESATGNVDLGINYQEVHFFGVNGTLETKRGTLAIANEQNILTLRKVWHNLYNDTMEAPVDSIQVGLYRYPENGSKDTQSAWVQNITLTKAGGWTAAIPLENGYRYYVVEQGTGEGELAFFEVKYSDNNTDGVIGGGTITITNKQQPAYELPATGSTGTTPYTAGGALMMGTALVCKYLKKRRRGKEAE